MIAKELVYWRDIKKSAVVFLSGFLLLLSFALFSLVSIVSYVSLIALSISVSFVVYKKVLQAVQKTPDGHPFKYACTCCCLFEAAVQPMFRLVCI